MKRVQSIFLVVVVTLTFLTVVGAFQLTAQAAGEAGQKMTAPATDWGGCRYFVRRGENLFRIALRHGVSYWYLAQINGLVNPNYIYAGMVLQVPCRGGYAPYYPPRPPKQCAASQTYLVQRGDNLFRIALNHGTTVNAIRNANNLWGRVLRPGTTLVIPCPGSEQYPGQTPVAPPPPAIPPSNAQTPIPPPPTTVPPPLTPGEPVEPSAKITLQNAQLNPTTVEIKAGQAVVWVNADQTDYTLVSGIPGQPTDQFSTKLVPGATFVFAYDAAGSYSFYIMEVPTLVGQVNVTP
jgi:LysM repeat protein/plastocyanin